MAAPRRRIRRNPVRYRGPRRGGRYKRRRTGGRGPFRGRRRGGLYRKRFRRNPEFVGGMIGALKQALPMALTLYLSRYASTQIATAAPQIGTSLGAYARPVMSIGLLGLGWFATAKVNFLRQWQPGILAGLGINVFDSLMTAFAPVNVRSMFGLSGLGEYLTVGAIPLNDGTSLGEYLTVGALEEMGGGMGDYIEVGAEEDLGLDQELGLDMELGDDDSGVATATAVNPGPVTVPSIGLTNPLMGGYGQGSMVTAVPTTSMVAAVPARSFTKQVPAVTSQYDKSNRLYTGIFGGGFGC